MTLNKKQHWWRKAGCLTLAFILFQLVQIPSTLAGPANPKLYKEKQPDGSVILVRLRGDEHFNWMEDKEGYTVVQANDKWFYYGQLNSKGLVAPTQLKVVQADAAMMQLRKHLVPQAAVRKNNIPYQQKLTSFDKLAVSPVGDVKNLVVLIRFSNHQSRTVPSQSDVEVLMNKPGGDPVLAPTGSLKDVYLENSYGQMQLNSDVMAWVTVSNTEQYYADGASGSQKLWEALKEALNVIDQNIDFRNYDRDNDGKIDAITFLHSGYDASAGGTDSSGVGVNLKTSVNPAKSASSINI